MTLFLLFIIALLLLALAASLTTIIAMKDAVDFHYKRAERFLEIADDYRILWQTAQLKDDDDEPDDEPDDDGGITLPLPADIEQPKARGMAAGKVNL